MLDAAVWTYRADPAGGPVPPRPPFGSRDDDAGGAITGQAYRVGVLVDAGRTIMPALRTPGRISFAS